MINDHKYTTVLGHRGIFIKISDLIRKVSIGI